MVRQLLNVPEEHVFRLKDGHIVKNLHSFLIHLIGMDDDTFNHHVNGDKNDFHNWVHHVVKDHHLAKKIHKTKDRNKMAKVVEKHIRNLEKLKHYHEKSFSQGIRFGAREFGIGLLIGLFIGFVVLRALGKI